MLPGLGGSAGSASTADTAPAEPATELGSSTVTGGLGLKPAAKSSDSGDTGRRPDFGLAAAGAAERRAGLLQSPNLLCQTSRVDARSQPALTLSAMPRH